MSPKRKERVAPPPGQEEWDVRYGTSDAVKGWEDLCRQVPENTRRAWELMRTEPCPVPTARHHRLKGSLAEGNHDGRRLPQWQLEVTGAGRIWYLLDTERRIVWITAASTGHPKATE